MHDLRPSRDFGGRRTRRKRNLSKFLSLILRHRPQEFGLKPDEKGYVPFGALLKAVQQTAGWKWVHRGDIVNIVEGGEKKRFEIVGDRIRALYGHSIPTKLDMEEVDPPEFLYHGTQERQAMEAVHKGLSPRNRQFVLLTGSPEEAIRIALRRVDHPALVIVHARRARESGVAFYRGSDGSYLSKKISHEFCEYDPENSADELHRHRFQRCLERTLGARRYVEQEDALEELFAVAPEGELQRTFLESLEDEDPVRRANAATSLLPAREETVVRLLARVERERCVAVLRNLAIALDLIPIEEIFEHYRGQVTEALRKLAACGDEYTRYRASATLSRLTGEEPKFDAEEFVPRPDMTDEELAKTISELPPASPEASSS
jgi:putative RNA 2'-phosphotransferase